MQSNEIILYDIEQLIEWPKIKETITYECPDKAHSHFKSLKFLAENAVNWGYWTLKKFGVPIKSGTSCNLHKSLITLINSQNSWLFTVSNCGKFVATLQESFLEIREIRDDHIPIIGRFSFAQDKHPQWRSITWNKNATMLSFSLSNGAVFVCDIKGIEICKLSPNNPAESTFDYSNAICGLVFIEVKEKLPRLIFARYNGSIETIEINNDTTTKYIPLHSFSLLSHYANGISDIVYEKNHNILLIGGCSGYHDLVSHISKSKKFGLTAWRILSCYPYYKEITDYANINSTNKRLSLFRRLSTVLEDIGQKLKGQVIDGINSISTSPSGNYLIAVHLSGKLSLWEVPSLRQANMWNEEEQPHFNETNSHADSEKVKSLREYKMWKNITSSSWWDDNSVILSRSSGSLTVVSIKNPTLPNLLGKECEWLEPSSRVSHAKGGVFLSLECSSKIVNFNRQFTSDNKENEMEYDPFLDDMDHEENKSFIRSATRLGKNILWNITESEYFQPPRKRPKIVSKIYRLVAFLKTTPLNLFNKKLELEEYGAALSLAESYNIDSDKVYQRQWEKATVSKASIQDYLSKIKNKEWVMRECCDRVPKDLDAAKELIKFGLESTDLKDLCELGFNSGQTNKRNELDNSDNEEEYRGFNLDEQRSHERKIREIYVQKWRKLLNIHKLTLHQCSMLRCRTKLLVFSDRLCTLEELLGGYDAAKERYSDKIYSEFRSQSILEIALNYARNCNWNAVEILLKYHQLELHEHTLVILSNFPETVMPNRYEFLLPTIDSFTGNVTAMWESAHHRDEKDWSEASEFMQVNLKLPINSFVQDFYDENESFLKFRAQNLTPIIIEKWYITRSCHLECGARNIEGAMQMLKFAMSNGFPNLASLRQDIGLLGTLIFECNWDPGLTLTELNTKSNSEKLGMLLQNSSVDMFIRNFRKWAIPFLEKCNSNNGNIYFSLLREYLVNLAKDDIKLPYLVVKDSIPGKCVSPIIKNADERVKICLDCIYEMNNTEQLKSAKDMVDCLADQSSEEIKMLLKQLFVCLTAYKQGVKVLPLYIKDIQTSRARVKKLLIRISRSAVNRDPQLKEKGWLEVLEDMQLLRNKIFSETCQLEGSVCLEIFIESLLTSGNLNNFKMAENKMMTSLEEENMVANFNNPSTITQKLSYESAINLVLNAALEYFDASAPSPNNGMMSLARECLLLIKDYPPKIQEFLDLIDGMILLKTFGVEKLPLQVRIMNDRLNLIDEALEASSDNYKKTEALLRLGGLLRVFGNNEFKRKGIILIKIAEKSLLKQDFSTAFFLCEELVKQAQKDAWKICLELVSVGRCKYIKKNKYLLEFILCYCDTDCLPSVMTILNSTNSKILNKKFNNVIGLEEKPNLFNRNEELDLESGDKESTCHEKALDEKNSVILSMTVTKANTKEKTMPFATNNILSETSHSCDKKNVDILFEDGNIDVKCNHFFEIQAYDEFYSQLPSPNVGLNLRNFSYNISDNVVAKQVMLRMCMLKTLDNTETLKNNEMLKALSLEIFPHDFIMGIGYLLSIPDVQVVESCLNAFPMTSISLQIAVYYYSIFLISKFYNTQPLSKLSVLYKSSPFDVTEEAKKVASLLNDKCEDKIPIVNLFRWREKLNDFIQGEKLHGLGRGISLMRFANDSKYCLETVIGLAMTDDIEQYKLAVSLAGRYNADLWIVLITHLEYMFTDCECLSIANLEKRIEELQMIPELISRPCDFFTRLDTYIYPLIEGTNHDKLLLYFYLLSHCEKSIENCISRHNLCKMTPTMHIKTIKKIKSTCINLDYKLIITNTLKNETEMEFINRIFSILEPYLTFQLVPMFVKIMSTIKYEKYYIDASLLYMRLAEKMMKLSSNENLSDLAWLGKIESIMPALQKICAQHLLQFIKNVLFLSEYSNKIPIEVKIKMTKQVLKLGRTQATKFNKEKLLKNNTENFNSVIPELQRISRHLDSYSTNFINNLYLDRNNLSSHKYFELYNNSQGEPELILYLAVRMLEDGNSSAFIKKLLSVSPGNKWKVVDVLEKSISSVFDKFQNKLLTNKEASKIIHTIVCIVAKDFEHKVHGGLTPRDVISQLQKYFNDDCIDVNLRVDILKCLENKFVLDQSEVMILLYYQTAAIVKSQWSNEFCKNILNKFSADIISMEEGRFKLFNSLLETVDIQYDQLCAIVSMLKMWPKFQNEKQFEHVWNQTLMLLSCSKNGSDEIVKIVNTCPDVITCSIMAPVCESLIENNYIRNGLKCILISDLLEQDRLSSIMQNVVAMSPLYCDAELIKLLLLKDLAHTTIGTLYYPILVEYLMSDECNQSEKFTNALVNKLQDLGHVAEAGTLLLHLRGSHPALHTFGTAMSYLAEWLQK